MSIRIFIADDHRMFREALRSALGVESDIEVVGEASSGEETLALVPRLLPDLLLLDIALPDQNGIEIARKLTLHHPSVRIIALTGYADRLFVEEMLKAGVQGYVLKSSGAEDLVKAIHSVARGHDYLSPEATQALLHRFRSAGNTASPPLTVLSKREREVLRLLAEGQRSSQIAEELGITASTVDVYRRNLKQKLGIHTMAELTRYAIREGLATV